MWREKEREREEALLLSGSSSSGVFTNSLNSSAAHPLGFCTRNPTTYTQSLNYATFCTLRSEKIH